MEGCLAEKETQRVAVVKQNFREQRSSEGSGPEEEITILGRQLSCKEGNGPYMFWGQ